MPVKYKSITPLQFGFAGAYVDLHSGHMKESAQEDHVFLCPLT